jgi:hypothetical protein
MPLKNANISVLNQLGSLIEQLDTVSYSMPLAIINGATLGKHVRHILDFYTNILKMTDNTVYYDHRERDVKLETLTPNALNYITHIQSQLTTIKENENVYVVISVNANYSPKVASTMERELIYALEHTTHHLAIIKIAVTHSFKHISIPDNFGVAASTIQFQQQH